MKPRILEYSTFFLLIFSAVICHAQTLGYVDGINIYSFNPSTGAIVNTFPGIGVPEIAVSPDDLTVYLATGLESLNVVSGKTGQTTGVVDLSLLSDGVVLTKDGSTAYTWSTFAPMVPGGLAVVDTSTLSVKDIIYAAATVDDVTLSPDDSTLYVSVHCGGADCQSTQGNCPVGKGICAFDRSTLALKWTVPEVNGLMAVSQDGASLYVTTLTVGGGNRLYVVNTATQAVTRFVVPASSIFSRVAVDPFSHYGVFVDLETAYILNTSTNKFVGKLFSNMFDNGTAVSQGSGPVFAPDGKSIWMLLACNSNVVAQCTLPAGATTLAGFAFPSGALISENSVDMYASSIAFPR